MPITTNPYATLAQVKAALDLQNTTDDSWLQELLDAATEEVDRYVGYSFQQDGTLASPTTKVYDGNDTNILFIDPVISFSAVIEKNWNLYLSVGGVFTAGTPTTMDITVDCILGPNNRTPGYTLTRLTDLPFFLGKQNYQVTGIWGYPAVPQPITRATVRLAIHYYKMRDSNYTDLIVEQGAVRQRFKKVIPDDVTEILNQYKRRLFLAW